jgi:ABC-2 type transport system permease protein
MTASTTIHSTRIAGTGAAGARFAGFRPLVRKEIADWRHGHRLWVIPAILVPFMTLTAANAWITTTIAQNLPPDVAPPAAMSLAPMDNLLAAVSTQVFILAAIFASMSLLIAERERGTLAWVASKPVARGGIWTAKWVASSAIIGLVAVVVPMAATIGLVTVLYGVPDVVVVAATVVGMIAVVALYVAVSLAVSTAVDNQAGVAAVGFGLFVLPPVLAAIVPFDIAPFLPTSILVWIVGLVTGAPVGVVTPIVWVVAMVALVAVAVRHLEGAEL